MQSKVTLEISQAVRQYSDAIAAEMCEYLRGMNPGVMEIRNTAPHYKIMERIGFIIAQGNEVGSYKLTPKGLDVRERLQRGQLDALV